MEEGLGDGTQNNAMAECALALAMAFFSIMVLTMVSMGAGAETDRAGTPPSGERISLRPSAPSDAPVAKRSQDAKFTLFIHYGGSFYDSRLEPLDPATAATGGPAVLAIDPALSMAEAIAARRRIAHPDLTVTTLDRRWLTALKKAGK
jgi:hypothetical protein